MEIEERDFIESLVEMFRAGFEAYEKKIWKDGDPVEYIRDEIKGLVNRNDYYSPRNRADKIFWNDYLNWWVK